MKDIVKVTLLGVVTSAIVTLSMVLLIEIGGEPEQSLVHMLRTARVAS